jgi:hypothetical protein
MPYRNKYFEVEESKKKMLNSSILFSPKMTPRINQRCRYSILYNFGSRLKQSNLILIFMRQK